MFDTERETGNIDQSSDSLPSYSISSPLTKNLRVGSPSTLNLDSSLVCIVTSTLPSFMADPPSSRTLAAFAYSGASALQ